MEHTIVEEMIILFTGGGITSVILKWMSAKVGKYGQRFLTFADRLETYLDKSELDLDMRGIDRVHAQEHYSLSRKMRSDIEYIKDKLNK